MTVLPGSVSPLGPPGPSGPSGPSSPRRNYAFALLLGAAGAALALLAVRQGWARAVYVAPRPLPSQSITVSGQDVAPAAGALALAGLACLAAIIATRGVARRAAGVVLALCGAGTAVAVSGSFGSSRVIAAAATKVSSSASVASGGAGSTTGGTSSPGGAVVTGGSAVHTVMLGVPWRVAVFAGAAAVIASGLLTAWRGARWPVMSGRYERSAERPPGAARPSPAVRASRPGSPASPPGSPPGSPSVPVPSSTLDPASLWDSISRGEDPTESLRGPGTG